MEEYSIEYGQSVDVSPHAKFRNIIVMDSGPGTVTITRGDGIETSPIWVQPDQTILVFDRDGCGCTLTASDDLATVSVMAVFSRALFAAR
jgi:hypothetical protein